MREISLIAKSLAFVASVATLASGCGTNDPYSVLQQTTDNPLPLLGAPISTNSAFFVRPFGNGIDGFQYFANSAYTGQPNVIAPGPGTVEYIDPNLNSGFYAITIYHSALLTSRVSGMQTVSVQIGAYVNGGDTIGTMPVYAAGVLPIQLDVYPNGGPAACPLSYMTSAARVAFQFSYSGVQEPCLQ